MQLGRLLTIINFTLLGVAIGVYLFIPAIADFFLYVLLAWMFASIVLFYLPISQRRIGSGAPPPPTTTPATVAVGAPPASAPLTSGRAPTATLAPAEPSSFAFCIYCGTDLPSGAVICPACGKAVRRF